MGGTTVKLKRNTRDNINTMRDNFKFISVNELLEYITNDLDIKNTIASKRKCIR